MEDCFEEPQPSDCCGNGCSPCVFDIYRELISSQLVKENYTSEDHLRTDLLSQTRFKPFKLIEKHQLVESVYKFTFKAVDKSLNSREVNENIRGILPYNIGQHLTLRCYIIDDEINSVIQNQVRQTESSGVDTSKNKMVLRAFTPFTIASQEENCCFSIFAKLYENGIASEYLKRSVVNDICYWRGPSGSFQYKPNSFSYILMLSVGTGLAPMISIINSILGNESDETLIHVKCGFKNINRVILRDELTRMVLYWNFTLEYFFSEIVPNNNTRFGETVNKGRIGLNTVKEYIKDKHLNKLLILLCGTDQFICQMRCTISELGVDTCNNVHIF